MNERGQHGPSLSPKRPRPKPISRTKGIKAGGNKNGINSACKILIGG